ncbi:LacI family DNA-binding transcriptional regulator [Jiangella sp. DSM 45060]|uniref:LacI family DNA-binding transcriptional regulator n=1 Tax=Jiangella sp. DSM 45060 TaxID=1798224 RepID=UPI000879E0F3|nr:LacI family DNA-binding transcriptional regulator [Jiangella sp. DSM 45060]SDT57140.1 transcriptional regulator, LacI family [Jiangella sp. DSM 45060]
MAVGRITIEDVAAAAGVSRQTVTRAMNGLPEISARTRDHVLRTAAELGYRPSRFASNLAARRKARSVGLVLGSLRNPYYTELAAELLDVVTPRGWQLLMTSHEQGDDVELVAALSGQTDAIVGYFTGPETALVAAARGVPLVQVERTATVPGMHAVILDFEGAIESLLDELRGRGARRFGLIESGRPDGDYRPTRRRRAYERFAGPGSAARVVVADESIRGGADGLARLRSEHPDVDTVLAFNDLMAMGAIQRAQLDGVAVPADLRVVGVDGLSLGAVMTPSLSTLSIDRRALATEAADIVGTLLDRAEPPPHPSVVRTVTPRPLWRESA